MTSIRMLNSPVLFFIFFYQRYLSSLKSYKCAYGVSTGKTTCSAYGKKVFSRFPPLVAYKLLQRQFNRCFSSNIGSLKKQKGFCGLCVADKINNCSAGKGCCS